MQNRTALVTKEIKGGNNNIELLTRHVSVNLKLKWRMGHVEDKSNESLKQETHTAKDLYLLIWWRADRTTSLIIRASHLEETIYRRSKQRS